MALVAGHQIVCTGSFGAFEKLIVGWVLGNRQSAGWTHDLGRVSDQPHRPRKAIPSDTELRPGENLDILGENVCGSGEMQFSSKHEIQSMTLEAICS
jgi:hypothetical protein